MCNFASPTSTSNMLQYLDLLDWRSRYNPWCSYVMMTLVVVPVSVFYSVVLTLCRYLNNGVCLRKQTFLEAVVSVMEVKRPFRTMEDLVLKFVRILCVILLCVCCMPYLYQFLDSSFSTIEKNQ